MEDEPPPSRAKALVVLLLLLGLVAGGWVLARHLAEVAKTEDCLMAGRRNCAPIRPGS
ncbi:MAG: hypothetical protein IT555_13540 [Acetobacteraceae bacterium]|nr:hypothetical protein [Acetobacteraceae bacterium]